MVKFYLDTCIWRDYFENRSDKFRPLGDWALLIIKKIIEESDLIIFSDLVKEELFIAFSETEIKEILSIVPEQLLIRIVSSAEQLQESIKLARELKLPKKDVLHAILARDNDAVLISRDKHFSSLTEQVTIKKPEDLI